MCLRKWQGKKQSGVSQASQTIENTPYVAATVGIDCYGNAPTRCFSSPPTANRCCWSSEHWSDRRTDECSLGIGRNGFTCRRSYGGLKVILVFVVLSPLRFTAMRSHVFGADRQRHGVRRYRQGAYSQTRIVVFCTCCTTLYIGTPSARV